MHPQTHPSDTHESPKVGARYCISPNSMKKDPNAWGKPRWDSTRFLQLERAGTEMEYDIGVYGARGDRREVITYRLNLIQTDTIQVVSIQDDMVTIQKINRQEKPQRATISLAEFNTHFIEERRTDSAMGIDRALEILDPDGTPTLRKGDDIHNIKRMAHAALSKALLAEKN